MAGGGESDAVREEDEKDGVVPQEGDDMEVAADEVEDEE